VPQTNKKTCEKRQQDAWTKIERKRNLEATRERWRKRKEKKQKSRNIHGQREKEKEV
jgi:hypothetical protein